MENANTEVSELVQLKKMRKINKQEGSQWKDEKGLAVELKRISKLEKVREKYGYSIGAKALQVETLLAQLRGVINEAIVAITQELKNEAGTPELDIKGHTFYNFDRSVKVFRQVTPLIDYDEGKMQTAQAAFTEFVEKKMGNQPELSFLKDMILSAFKTTRDKFDTRKINTLLMQRDNTFVANDVDFQKAIRLVIEAKITKEERIYDQVYIRNVDSGEYEVVNLNLASI